MGDSRQSYTVSRWGSSGQSAETVETAHGRVVAVSLGMEGTLPANCGGHTTGYKLVSNFDSTRGRISSRSYSQQYQQKLPPSTSVGRPVSNTKRPVHPDTGGTLGVVPVYRRRGFAPEQGQSCQTNRVRVPTRTHTRAESPVIDRSRWCRSVQTFAADPNVEFSRAINYYTSTDQLETCVRSRSKYTNDQYTFYCC